MTSTKNKLNIHVQNVDHRKHFLTVGFNLIHVRKNLTRMTSLAKRPVIFDMKVKRKLTGRFIS